MPELQVGDWVRIRTYKKIYVVSEVAERPLGPSFRVEGMHYWISVKSIVEVRRAHPGK